MILNKEKSLIPSPMPQEEISWKARLEHLDKMLNQKNIKKYVLNHSFMSEPSLISKIKECYKDKYDL